MAQPWDLRIGPLARQASALTRERGHTSSFIVTIEQWTLLSQLVKEFWKSVNIWRSHGQSWCPVSLLTGYSIATKYVGQWLCYTPLVWGKLLASGGDIGGLGAVPPAGSRGRAPGQGVWGRSPQKLKAFCFTIFFRGTHINQTLWPILTHDGSKCAESRKDVPFWG